MSQTQYEKEGEWSMYLYVNATDGRGILREGWTKQYSDKNKELHGKTRTKKHTRY